MLEKEFLSLVEKLQQTKSEDQTLEVKRALEGCPKRLYDSLSSFSNQDTGGIIIFGLDEKTEFSITGVYDANDLQKKIMEQCKQMEPRVNALISVFNIDGKNLVCAEIPGMDIFDRPCYYRGVGKLKGSYTRIGDADAAMTEYEVYTYEAYKKRYQDDKRVIEGVTLDMAINKTKLDRYIGLLKENKPNIAQISDANIYNTMSITKDGVPTLASILLFGHYPQAHLPQLCIVATSIPGTQMGVIDKEGARFVDNKRIEGTISDMLDGAITFVKNNMRVKTIIDPVTGKRNDKTEYPLTAIREILLNALVHRDYSIHTEGQPIQITMYEDRIEIINPGGLYGQLKIETLGKKQGDTRNPVIATALEVLKVTENRYSGIPTIRREVNEWGHLEVEFVDKRDSFEVKIYKRMEANNNSDETTRLLNFCKKPRSKEEIAEFLGIKTVSYAVKAYVKPLLEEGSLLMKYPENPGSHSQMYYTNK